MRLTNTIRDAFVRAVMQDVPKVDYQKEYQAAIVKHANALLPKKIRDLANDPAVSPHLVSSYIYMSGMPSIPVVGAHDCTARNVITGHTDVQKIVANIKEQNEKRQELEYKVRAAIYGCTTLKQAKQMLSEFVKYLPTEAEPTKMLPQVAGLVSALTEAGFPKDEPWGKK